MKSGHSPLSRSFVRWTGTLIGPWTALVMACGPSQPASDPLKSTTNQEALGRAVCVAGRPSTTPDLMAWDSESRLNLNRLRHTGIVAVRYQTKGCDVQMELLSNCIAQGTYEYTPYYSKEQKIAHDESDLYAKLPIGAASLAGKVAGNRSVRTDYVLVGEHALPPDATFQRADFHGADCSRATHVVSAVYVGGFALVTGTEREISAAVTVFGAGAGAGQSASVERIASEGDADACEEAKKAAAPNQACNVPLRVGLLPISDVVVAADPDPVADATDAGSGAAAPSAASDAPHGNILSGLLHPSSGPSGQPGIVVINSSGGPGFSVPSGFWPGSGPVNNAPSSPATAPLAQPQVNTQSQSLVAPPANAIPPTNAMPPAPGTPAPAPPTVQPRAPARPTTPIASRPAPVSMAPISRPAPIAIVQRPAPTPVVAALAHPAPVAAHPNLPAAAPVPACPHNTVPCRGKCAAVCR